MTEIFFTQSVLHTQKKKFLKAIYICNLTSFEQQANIDKLIFFKVTGKNKLRS